MTQYINFEQFFKIFVVTFAIDVLSGAYGLSSIQLHRSLCFGGVLICLVLSRHNIVYSAEIGVCLCVLVLIIDMKGLLLSKKNQASKISKVEISDIE